ncbi:MAG: 5-methyltetrahydropteroyltriglutamate--homocysteine S-methyltransferase [Steroidobacteraceae bacterium]
MKSIPLARNTPAATNAAPATNASAAANAPSIDADVARRPRPPFRAEHVGSLLRPAALAAARRQHEAGKLSAEQLREAEDCAVHDAVRMQEELGFEAVTDGELRRGAWHMDYLYQIGGVARAASSLKLHFQNASGGIEFTTSALAVTAALRHEKTIFGNDFLHLKSVARAVPKLTIPSPSMVHYRGGRAAVDPRVYPDLGEFFADLKRAYAGQIAALGALGCTYLQLDDTSLAYLNDPAQRDHVHALGGDAARQHLVYIDLINGALAGRPAGMTVCVHLCRGNFRSSWVASGGYDHVAEALFNELRVDGFFLEYDDERSGGFEPLRFVPRDKRVVLGLVTSKRPQLENGDDVKRRVDAAARFLDLDQLCLSPQCGFASTAEGNALDTAQQRAKLELVARTAREIWG